MHQVLLCLTCSSATYRKRVWFSEWQDPDPESDAGPVYEDTLYPPRLIKLLPNWHGQLPEKLKEVLRQSYAALQHDLRYVSAVGCRTALDMAVVEKIGDVGGFREKLADLVQQKHISGDEQELIRAIIDSGDAAAHRGFQPQLKQMHVLFEILERVLYNFYIKPNEDKALLEEARKITADVPPRPKKAS